LLEFAVAIGVAIRIVLWSTAAGYGVLGPAAGRGVAYRRRRWRPRWRTMLGTPRQTRTRSLSAVEDPPTRTTATARLEREKDGRWTVELEEEPRVHTWGKTVDQALRRVREAAALWFRPTRTPSS
jgi:hypothetical protein